MLHGRTRLRRTAIYAAALACAVTAALPLPPESERWIRVETDHFVLFSNAGERRTTAVGRNLERLRSVLRRTSRGMTVHSPLPTRIYVFRNATAMAPYNIGPDGKPEALAGYFVASDDANYVAVDVSSAGNSFAVIYHEYIHYFVDNNLPTLPVWFNEGLAEFYSTFTVRGNTAEIGRPVDVHLAELAGRRPIPLERLFRVTPDSRDYNETQRKGTFYAQSWALVHYLMTESEATRRTVDAYFERLRAGEDPAGAFWESIGMDAPQLEEELERYVRRKRFNFYRLPLEGDADVATAEIRGVDRAEYLHRLGDLLANHPPVQHESAERHLRAALAIDPNIGGAYRALGRLAELRNDHGAAAGLYRRAIEADPADASSHARLGLCLLEGFLVREPQESVLPERTPPALLDARRHLRRSLQLDPDRVESLAGFGATFAYDADGLDEGIDALETAHRLQPSRVDVIYHLVLLKARAGRTDEARTLLERRLRPRTDRVEMLRAAEGAIVDSRIRDAIDAHNRGERDLASAILSETLAATTDDGLRDRLRKRRDDLGAAGRAADDVGLYNRAVDALNAQRFEQAVDLLRQLRDTTTDPEMRRLAVDRLASIRDFQRRDRLVERFNEAVRRANEGSLGEAMKMLESILEEDPPSGLRERCEQVLSEMRRKRGPGESFNRSRSP